MTATLPDEQTEAQQFRTRRQELGLTLETVAKRADCALSTVIRFEGERGPQQRKRPAVERIRRVLWPDA